MNNSQPANILTASVWGSVGAIGLIGNITLVTLLSKNLKNSKPYEKVIFATLLTDLCSCFNAACLEPYGIMGRTTTFCKTSAFLFALFANMNHVWMGINMFSRYSALYHKKIYKQWFNIRGIVFFYVIGITVNMPILVVMTFYDGLGLNNMGICGGNPVNAIVITTLCSLSGQVFTIGSNVTCVVFGYLIIKKIRNHVSNVGSNLDSNLVEESRQIVIFVFVSAIIPILVQSPITVVRILQYFRTVSPWTSRAAASFFPIAPASAPFVTASVIRPYRKKVLKLFSRGTKVTVANTVRMNIVNR